MKKYSMAIKMNTDCPICFEPLPRKKYTFPSCNHKFCKKCINALIKHDEKDDDKYFSMIHHPNLESPITLSHKGYGKFECPICKNQSLTTKGKGFIKLSINFADNFAYSIIEISDLKILKKKHYKLYELFVDKFNVAILKNRTLHFKIAEDEEVLFNWFDGVNEKEKTRHYIVITPLLTDDLMINYDYYEQEPISFVNFLNGRLD